MPMSPITRPTYMGSFASSAKSMFAMLLPLWPTPGPAADIRAFSDTINDVYEEDLRGRQGLMLELPRQTSLHGVATFGAFGRFLQARSWASDLQPWQSAKRQAIRCCAESIE